MAIARLHFTIFTMNPECNYSFKDLYTAAFKRAPKQTEMLELFAMSRDEINRTVKAWAKIAGWQTGKRQGADGNEYLAFWP